MDIIRKVVDVEGAGGHHLDRLIVANKPSMAYIDIRNIRRLSYIHTAEDRERESTQAIEFNNSTINVSIISLCQVYSQFIDKNIWNPDVGSGNGYLFNIIKFFWIPHKELIYPLLLR